jgi:hypothetical protein
MGNFPLWSHHQTGPRLGDRLMGSFREPRRLISGSNNACLLLTLERDSRRPEINDRFLPDRAHPQRLQQLARFVSGDRRGGKDCLIALQCLDGQPNLFRQGIQQRAFPLHRRLPKKAGESIGVGGDPEIGDFRDQTTAVRPTRCDRAATPGLIRAG